MAEEKTTVSTPVETTGTDTSANVEPTNADTSTAEPNSETTTAETETQPEELYAGKYKTVDELVKGYKESEKAVTKAAEIEKKYNELLQKQETEYRKAEQQRLEQARQRGFRTAEDAEISDKVQVAEFKYYANNLNSVNPADYETVRQNLLSYYNTGNKSYLDEAKRYFPSNLIENIALQKERYENQLKSERQAKQNEINNANNKKLAEELRTDFADFLGDIQTNAPKSQALEMFCVTGLIQSKEDMQVFQDVYSNIEKNIKEQAIKEYEAQKAIDNTKDSAAIQAGSSGYDLTSGQMPTYEQVANMSQSEYEEAYKKYGDKLWTAK